MVEIRLQPLPLSLSFSQEGNGVTFSIPLVDLRSSNWEEMREAIAAILVLNGSLMLEEDLDEEKIKAAILHAVMFAESLHIEVVDDAD